MALPAPRSPLGSDHPRRNPRSHHAMVHEADGLAPARGIMIGLVVVLAAFWGPLAAGLFWLLD